MVNFRLSQRVLVSQELVRRNAGSKQHGLSHFCVFCV